MSRSRRKHPIAKLRRNESWTYLKKLYHHQSRRRVRDAMANDRLDMLSEYPFCSLDFDLVKHYIKPEEREERARDMRKWNGRCE